MLTNSLQLKIYHTGYVCGMRFNRALDRDEMCLFVQQYIRTHVMCMHILECIWRDLRICSSALASAILPIFITVIIVLLYSPFAIFIVIMRNQHPTEGWLVLFCSVLKRIWKYTWEWALSSMHLPYLFVYINLESYTDRNTKREWKRLSGGTRVFAYHFTAGGHQNAHLIG